MGKMGVSSVRTRLRCMVVYDFGSETTFLEMKDAAFHAANAVLSLRRWNRQQGDRAIHRVVSLFICVIANRVSDEHASETRLRTKNDDASILAGWGGEDGAGKYCVYVCVHSLFFLARTFVFPVRSSHEMILSHNPFSTAEPVYNAHQVVVLRTDTSPSDRHTDRRFHSDAADAIWRIMFHTLILYFVLKTLF